MCVYRVCGIVHILLGCFEVNLGVACINATKKKVRHWKKEKGLFLTNNDSNESPFVEFKMVIKSCPNEVTYIV